MAQRLEPLGTTDRDKALDMLKRVKRARRERQSTSQRLRRKTEAEYLDASASSNRGVVFPNNSCPALSELGYRSVAAMAGTEKSALAMREHEFLVRNKSRLNHTWQDQREMNPKSGGQDVNK